MLIFLSCVFKAPLLERMCLLAGLQQPHPNPPALPACPLLSSRTAGIHGTRSLANPLMSLPGTWRTGSSGFPSWRQRLLPVLNSASQAISSLLYPGLAGYGIILRYKKSYFYFITIIIIAAKEDESRVLSMPWENLDLRLDL